MAEDLIVTIRLLIFSSQTDGGGGSAARGSSQGASGHPAAESLELRVLNILGANPHATWKVVRDDTGLSDANAKRALTWARKRLRSAPREEVQAAGA
jgi:hypothetical protein